MSALAVFTREGHDLRTLLVDGEPWFVLADACAALDLSNPSMVAARIDDDDALSSAEVIDSMGRAQTARIVSEPGLYEVIFLSRKPEAKAFKRWITHEVLPAIRRTGTYSVAPQPFAIPETLEDALILAGEEMKARKAAEARAVEATERVEQLEPAAAAWSDVVDADGTFDLAATAKLLGTGQVRLMARLRNDRVLTRANLPRQEHIETGRMVVKVTPWHKPDGSAHVSRTTRVTAKGIDWLHARYGGTPAVVPLSLVGA